MAAIPEDVLKKMAEDKKAAETKLEKILSDFEKANDTKTETPGKNLRALLDQSPDLKARILDSVQKGHLEKFDVLPAGANAGGSYSPDTKTIELPADYLKKAGKDKAAAAELVFVMGHEIQHSFNSTVSDKATDAFVKDVDKIAKGPGPHDYTNAVKTLIQNYREDEAGAHIGGFNAIASQVMKDNPKAGLKELYNAHPGRMEDFIERGGKAPNFTYALKQGLTLEADNTLKSSPENVKAMGKHYFDQPPSSARLGTKGNQDYPNYYGEWALNVINDAEKQALADAKKADPKAVAPEVKIDLKSIGLDKSLMDTGLKFTDSSPKKPIVEAPAPEPALYRQAEAALKKVDGLGLQGEDLRNVVAATALLAQTSGMERIDGALLGKNGQLFAYQGNPASESADRVAVNVAQAKQQPADQSLATMIVPDVQQAPAQQPQRSQSM
jgi:hypothetical protein